MNFSKGSGEDAAQTILDDIRNGKYNSAQAYGFLQKIINDLPGTSVAREAKAYLDMHF